MYYKEAGVYKDSLGVVTDIIFPSLKKMKEDIHSSTPIEDVDVRLIWDAIFNGEVVMYLSKKYDRVLSFRAKGASPHNRVKFSFVRRGKKGFFYKQIKKIVVDEDKWYE